ncbi:PREDICTED: uncharacterized protein LOC104079764, partial [Fulmarus glacialis]|uniref:uncharacterized protein LOC104079764 n=1 Tax=Fulmarus glacialis TaxID=30455 RepID=UPI00051BDCBA
MKSVDCVHVIQQKDTASSPSAPPGAASGTTGLFSVTFLWLAMLLSSCLAAVSLYHVITLKTELEALHSKLIYRVQARSPLDRPPVSPEENKAGTPVSSFLQVSAAGARQENRLPGPGPAESFQKEIWNGSRNRGRRSVVHTDETEENCYTTKTSPEFYTPVTIIDCLAFVFLSKMYVRLSPGTRSRFHYLSQFN